MRRVVHELGDAPEALARFWVLLGAGCGIWLIGQAVWTYFEVILRQDVPNPFVGDVILFVHPVSMIGALALNPHDQRDDLNVHIGYIDFSLLLVWWIYLYLFIVIPWQFIAPNLHSYGVTYDYLSGIENAVLVAGFAVLLAKTKGPWRQVYSHLFGAALTYAASSVLINVAIDSNNYYTGSPYDLPLVASFVWFGTAGIVPSAEAAARIDSVERGAAAVDVDRGDDRGVLDSLDGAMEFVVQFDSA